MESTLKHTEKATLFPENWKRESDVFTGDDLIDAYLEGKKDGKDEVMKILTRQFDDNLETATGISEKLYEAAAKKGIKFRTIHLKADGITKFSALGVVSKSDFVSDNFREVFIAARKLKNQVESDSFYISFSFVPYSKELNEKCITADGVFLKYVKK